jgi:hypothetical protein
MNRRGLGWILFGAVSTPLGLLWLLQGADLVHVRPILCVANCQPLVGGSIGWMAAGAIFMVLGLAAIAVGLRRRGRGPGV